MKTASTLGKYVNPFSVSDSGKEWDEQLMDFLYPGMERRFAFDEDQVAVNPIKLKQLIGSIYSQAEQRGYERAKRELEPKYGGQG